MKMKKIFVLGLTVLILSFWFISCSDGSDNNKPIVVNGWTIDPFAHPNSNVQTTVNGETITFTGSVGFRNDKPTTGGVELGFIPNTERLAALKTSDGISIKIKTNREVNIQIRTSDVTDWDHFRWDVSKSGSEQTLTLNFVNLNQGGWGETVSFNKANIEIINIQILAEVATGSYEIIIKDLEPLL